MRTILHVDMDAFYVSVEMRRHPELSGLPVVVGGSGQRGVVAAANYEARRFGVFSAMSSAKAKRLCPQAVFIPGDHAHYAAVSKQVHEIFDEFTPHVEPIALDEAFLDVTGASRLFGDGIEIGHRIRSEVELRLQLPCSVGVATNKFLAKLASKAAKPRPTQGGIEPGPGVLSVEPGRELEFLHPLPVSALWGVGPATLKKLDRLAVRTVGDLSALPDDIVIRAIGRAHGEHLLELARGVDERSVQSDREMKSIGHEETFSYDLYRSDDIRAEIVRLSDDVAGRLRRHGWAARTAMLKIKFSSFETITRSVTPDAPMTTAPALVAALEPTLATFDPSIGVRLVGVSVANFVEPVEQMSLFGTDSADSADVASVDRQWSSASRAIDQIRERFGRDAIAPARSVRRRRSTPWGPEAESIPEDSGSDPD
jgi:DNA polymerase IV